MTAAAATGSQGAPPPRLPLDRLLLLCLAAYVLGTICGRLLG